MKVGISSWTYSWALGVKGYEQPSQPLDAFTLLEKAIVLGADVLQLADNCPLHVLSIEELKQLGDRAKQSGILLEIGTRGTKPERLKLYLDITKVLDANLVRTLPHDIDDIPSLDEVADRLKEIAPEYEDAKVKLAVENHDYYRAKDLGNMLRGLNSKCIGACIDPVNNLAQGESSREVFEAFRGIALNFHCKDYTIKRKSSMLGFDVEGCPAGEGLLDLALAQKYFSDISWIVELWTPWQGDIESTMELENDYAIKSLENLRLKV